MIRTLFLVVIYLSLLGLGLSAPFVATLGYVWVDTFRPQAITYFVLNQLPVAMIMGVAALATYLLFDRRDPPKFTLVTGLTLLMAGWVTMTLMWAEVPNAAWGKWDWAFKTVLFSAFVPYVIRSRVQIEAFLQTLVFSLAATLVPFGAKVALSGGGYGRDLGLTAGNSGLSEGSTLATVAVMMIPLAFYLRKHTVILPSWFGIRQGYLILVAVAILTTIGTYERTGVVGLAIVGLYMFFQTRQKLLFIVGVGVVAAFIAFRTSQAWHARIDTISDPWNEGSALTRLLVWQWTFNYSLTHPLGGGFNSYLINFIEAPGGHVIAHRAFHSIYFEVLGEHGWPGLALFLSIAASSMLALNRARKQAARLPGLEWCRELAGTLQIALTALMVCGAFIGIAFQPWLYDMFALSVSVSQYVRRVAAPATPSWRTWNRAPIAAPRRFSAANTSPAPSWRRSTVPANAAGPQQL